MNRARQTFFCRINGMTYGPSLIMDLQKLPGFSFDCLVMPSEEEVEERPIQVMANAPLVRQEAMWQIVPGTGRVIVIGDFKPEPTPVTRSRPTPSIQPLFEEKPVPAVKPITPNPVSKPRFVMPEIEAPKLDISPRQLEALRWMATAMFTIVAFWLALWGTSMLSIHFR